MGNWTIDEMLALPTCYDRGTYEQLWAGSATLTDLEVLQHATPPPEDRAQIISHMADGEVLRLWACDMVEQAATPWPDHDAEVAELLEVSRAIAAGEAGNAARRAAKRRYRYAPDHVRVLLHERGSVAARLVFTRLHTTDPENGDDLLGLLATRLGG